MSEGGILTSVSVNVDGTALAIGVRLDCWDPMKVWVAELVLPAWITPRAFVSLAGIATEQETALHDLIQRTNETVARYAAARKSQ